MWLHHSTTYQFIQFIPVHGPLQSSALAFGHIITYKFSELHWSKISLVLNRPTYIPTQDRRCRQRPNSVHIIPVVWCHSSLKKCWQNFHHSIEGKSTVCLTWDNSSLVCQMILVSLCKVVNQIQKIQLTPTYSQLTGLWQVQRGDIVPFSSSDGFLSVSVWKMNALQRPVCWWLFYMKYTCSLPYHIPQSLWQCEIGLGYIVVRLAS